MSKYTTEIRFICESAIPLDKQGDGTNVEDAIESGRNVLFNFDYDLFSDEYKPVIESKFLRHNYVREIGFETVGLFKLRLRDEWLMKLPYYNKLWESALLEFDPFLDVDYQTQHVGSGNIKRDDTTDTTNSGTHGETGSNTNTATGNRSENESTSVDASKNSNEQGSGWNNRNNTQVTNAENSNIRNEDLLQKYSDTPQGGLDGVIETDWLTNATQNENEIRDNGTENRIATENGSDNAGSNVDRTESSSTSGVGNSNIITIDSSYGTAIRDIMTNNTGRIVLDGETVSSDTYLRRVWGKYNSRSYSKALLEFRETFLNIDEMFINEFKKLFMLIY